MITDSRQLLPLIEQVVQDHAEEVQRYRAGRSNLLGFLVGQVLKRAGGKADPGAVSTMLRDRLSVG